ncbi:hypothetical protein [Ruminiclostridium papyrosolvens]|uniref:Lipoprotein n=1 Tax=Ruminiclostridium papyrosolvens C7 TaxID=1330534 RepID=U4R299_9FIRM|nr:hypothetical protein [Ruminiclostridium papyrosolvens]EPR11733.1 hypothetical protein L323_10970 [Ruminiclostridium papyrosolvens C7]
MKKVKNIMASISALLICVTVLAGCGSDPVQDDLINYINNQLPTIATLEEKVSSEYQAVKADSNADDSAFGVKLKDVIIPAAAELIAKTKATVPATEEVKKVHDKYLASVTAQSEAFAILLDAVGKNDEKLAKTANDKLTEAERLSKEYLADLETLKKDHGVENKESK